VRIDLKAAGFVVTDLPIGRAVTAAGRLRPAAAKSGIGEREIVATGARFE
jgi:ribose/xylose/arabinose/galactoside ABC-type transport system permease subunit